MFSSVASRPLWRSARNFCCRHFSSSSKQENNTKHIRNRHKDVPEYPYGPALWYKQSDSGLYGGQMMRSGNNVGPKSKMRSPRSWHPSVIRKRLPSEILGKKLQLKMTTRVLRTIKKAGGLDQYILKPKSARIKDLGMEGWKIRFEMQQKINERNAAAAKSAKDLKREDEDYAAAAHLLQDASDEPGLMEETPASEPEQTSTLLDAELPLRGKAETSETTTFS